jgi:cell division septum initiation protein DivIVA
MLRTGKAPPPGTMLVDVIPEPDMSTIQKSEPILIEGKNPQWVEIPSENYKRQVPQSEIIENTYNPALNRMTKIGGNIRDELEALQGQKSEYAKKMAELTSRPIGGSYQNPGLDTEIMKQMESLPQESVPQSDMITEAILNLGPALGAMFLGESGALAAPVALKQGREIFHSAKKMDTDALNARRKESEARIRNLIALRKAGFDDSGLMSKSELEQTKMELEQLKFQAGDNAKEIEKKEQRLAQIEEQVAKGQMRGGEKLAEMELEKFRQAEKTKRTPKMVKKGEPVGEPDYIPGFKWNKKTPINKTDITKMQNAVADRDSINGIIQKVTDKVSKASALELSNPASEVRRSIESDLADAQLLYKGESFANLGVLAGPDVSYLDKVLDPPNMANTITRGGKEAVLQRYKEAGDRINERLANKLKYRGFVSDKGLSSINIPVKPEIIEKAGRKFMKKPNGKYEEVE